MAELVVIASGAGEPSTQVGVLPAGCFEVEAQLADAVHQPDVFVEQSAIGSLGNARSSRAEVVGEYPGSPSCRACDG
jgi:hypothetical protein